MILFLEQFLTTWYYTNITFNRTLESLTIQFLINPIPLRASDICEKEFNITHCQLIKAWIVHLRKISIIFALAIHIYIILWWFSYLMCTIFESEMAVVFMWLFHLLFNFDFISFFICEFPKIVFLQCLKIFVIVDIVDFLCNIVCFPDI